MPLCCAVTDSGTGQEFSWAPSRTFPAAGWEFHSQVSVPIFLSRVVFGPQERMSLILPDPLHYGSESKSFVLRLPESVHTKESQPAAALYRSLVETGRFFFLFSTDQPISPWLSISTSFHAPPDNMQSCSHCVQYGHWCDCIIQKFPVETPVPLTYDKVSPATYRHAAVHLNHEV